MATFKTEVVRLTIEEHPNADALELARVGDYVSIVQKGAFTTGDLAVYIPEQAVLPEWLIAELCLEGRLAGKQKNRVKAIKLRGVLSQGLIYGLDGTAPPPQWPDACTWAVVGEHDRMGVDEGSDVTEFLGITKYEPVIPTHMNGQVFKASGYTIKYDIENIKKHPNIFEEGEEVVITEKLHGTWACFGAHVDVDHPIVTSKGLSAQGLAFKFNDENANNLYIKTFREYEESLLRAFADRHDHIKAMYILGEIYGAGVQDLQYGATTPRFRVFDVYMGEPSKGEYLDADVIEFMDKELFGIGTVPLLYHGPYRREIVDELTNGNETVSGTSSNIREGIVIKPAEERRDVELGRVILKSVSEQYLLRKGHTTEYA